MANFTLRPMTVSERKYSYVQSPQIQGQTGNIGYLRGDFGSNGNWFYTTWFDTRSQWKSDEFKQDLDDVINALRSHNYGLLRDRATMYSVCRENKDSEMKGNYTTEFGFRADSEKYAFLLRCIPVQGDYNFYCAAILTTIIWRSDAISFIFASLLSVWSKTAVPTAPKVPLDPKTMTKGECI